MPKCAFLSTDNLEEFFVYDDLVKPHLREIGWSVEDVSWRDTSIDYNDFDLVVVRSTWDYQDAPEEFVSCLKNIEASDAMLLNPIELIQWNISKAYLQELASKGVAILPSIFVNDYDFSVIQSAFAHFDTETIIVKPLISANADNTFRLSKEKVVEQEQELETTFKKRAFIVQAFEPSILDPGEYSLFYFSDEYSHAILKTPAQNDFRVQEEHGGHLRSIPASEGMQALARKTLAALPSEALYARIDMLETRRGFEIIEVELIEPSLYFNMDVGSAKKFAHVIDNKYKAQTSD